MRQALWITLFCCIEVCLGRACAAQAPPQSAVQDFAFLVITDTHQTASGSVDPLKKLVSDAVQANPAPAFVIDTGDVTESGKPQEYARFKEGIAGLNQAHIGFYAVPGNHDVRWSSGGKQPFEQQFGKRYQSFDYGGVHFVLLDTTVLLEHWGHFDQAELEWLAKDMKRVKPETPVMLFMHHWIGREVPSERPIDNEFALWNPLRNHNVVAIFTGHGHSDLMWHTNGVVTLMARGLYQGSYHRVSMTPLIAHIERVVTGTDKPTTVADVALSRKDHPSELQVGWDDPDVPYLARRRPSARLEPRSVDDNPDKETAEYRIDDGAWAPLSKDARDIWRDTFLTERLKIGVHSVDMRVTTSNGRLLTGELIFEVERDEREPTRRWASLAEGPIQSSPTLAGDSLYVTDIDGRAYAFDAAKGRRRWSFSTKGPITGDAVVDGSVVYIGSSDHCIYALDRSDGRQIWRFDAGVPIWSTPAVAHGVVCIGAAGKIIGIDMATGTLRWTQPTGSFFQSRAASDGYTFYLGGWDNTLYALNAEDGALRWKAAMGKSQSGKGEISFYFSPAIASPFCADGRVYICSNDGFLHVVDSATGADVWTTRAPAGSDDFGYSSPVAANGVVYLAGRGGHGDVYAVSARDGSFLWTTATGQPIYDSSVRLSQNGKWLAIMGVRGAVSVLETSSGRMLTTYDLGPGNIFSSPAVDGSTVYTATMAHDVQAINLPVITHAERAPGGSSAINAFSR